MSGKAVNVTDYRALAKARLPHFLFEYIDGGSYDEVTLRRNVEDLQDIALRQRVLRDVSAIDLTTSLFGQEWAMPVGLGPVGLAGLYARRGEVQAARAAAAANVPQILSTVSACSPASRLASPKSVRRGTHSVKFTPEPWLPEKSRPAFSSMTLLGFTSRWTTPMQWA